MGWSEHDVGAMVGEDLQIPLPIARVLEEIVFRAKLERINEQRTDNAVAFRAGTVEERHVPGVQCAERGDKSDPPAQLSTNLAHRGRGLDHLHGLLRYRGL